MVLEENIERQLERRVLMFRLKGVFHQYQSNEMQDKKIEEKKRNNHLKAVDG
jgi:hypothetical protein